MISCLGQFRLTDHLHAFPLPLFVEVNFAAKVAQSRLGVVVELLVLASRSIDKLLCAELQKWLTQVRAASNNVANSPTAVSLQTQVQVLTVRLFLFLKKGLLVLFEIFPSYDVYNSPIERKKYCTWTMLKLQFIGYIKMLVGSFHIHPTSLYSHQDYGLAIQ